MSRLKTLVRNERGVPPLRGGHSLCQGCGIPVVVRTVLDTIWRPTVVVNATGCLEVATTRYPTTAWNVPWLHVAFENSAAVASGVESAQRALRRRHALPAGEDSAVVVAVSQKGMHLLGEVVGATSGWCVAVDTLARLAGTRDESLGDQPREDRHNRRFRQVTANFDAHLGGRHRLVR